VNEFETRDVRDRRFTAWVAIGAALLMFATIALSLGATGDDTALFFDPAKVFALPASRITLFRWWMVVDIFGFYLPFLILGGYLWRQLRETGGALVDMAALSVALYVLLGIAGASIQFAVLPALLAAHGTGDAAVRAASEASWLTTVIGSQRGLWAMEGPVLAFWGIVTGNALRTRGMANGTVLIMAGLAYALNYIASILDAAVASEMLTISAVLLLPVWALWFGVTLLHGNSL